MTDARTIPLDPASTARLADQGLTYRLIDTSSDADTEAFLRADARGFLDAEPTDEVVAEQRPHLTDRRNVGVFEAGTAVGTWPIATVNAWETPLTVPGGEIEMWAISSVTVAGTHRRRGVARALLEGELRAAADGGFAIAGLTVSEATIYGRYGFGSAVPVARIKVDTRRAGWTAGAHAGRMEYVDKQTLKSQLSALHDVARTQRSGQIAGWESRWSRAAGLTAGDSGAATVRGVCFRDESGAVRGVMAYRLVEVPGSFRFRLEIAHLTAVTPEALRALWGYAIQHDLVIEVTADLRPVDDPLPYLVADQRAVEITVHDHGWLRILDVPAALSARAYRAPLDVVLRVEDPLGFTAGSWRLRADAGPVVVETALDGEAEARLDVAALSMLYAGGVSAASLRAAGQLDATAEVAARLDDAFRAVQAPVLGIWY
jgi:predicted acetyltransferase